MTYLRMLAVILMVLGVFGLLCVVILFLYQFVQGGVAPPWLPYAGAAAGCGLLLGVASLLERMARPDPGADEPDLPVAWRTGQDEPDDRVWERDRFTDVPPE